jgi:UDP-glucuronate 4-epimerase
VIAMPYTVVTGCGGFIGSHFAFHLLQKGIKVIGIDRYATMASKPMKTRRLNRLLEFTTNFVFIEGDVTNEMFLERLFYSYGADISFVAHLAASTNKQDFFEQEQCNIHAFAVLLKVLKPHKLINILYASSSVVYGNIPTMAENQPLPYPISFYSLTKVVNEEMAEHFSAANHQMVTCVRLFPVYGPFCDSSVLLFKFFDQVMNGKDINLYHGGTLLRTYAYVDDILPLLELLLYNPISINGKYHNTVNIGATEYICLNKLIKIVEGLCERNAAVKYTDSCYAEQLRVVPELSKLSEVYKTTPVFRSIHEGLKLYWEWHQSLLPAVSNDAE